jgi:sugar O-acyltransferase (sialic acid O-acetyltransferase NeuD family)
MSGIVLFGIGSSIVVEYEETCRRLGRAIVAGVRNRPGPAYLLDPAVAVVDAGAIPAAVLSAPCICPMFRPQNRFVACEEAAHAGFRFAGALIDPTAVVASTTSVGSGSFVNAGCIVGAASALGEHVVVNRGASVGHHVAIAAFASLGPSAVIGGHVAIEWGATIGAGAVVLPKVRIGARAVVGAGAVVVADVPPGTKVLGVPARVVATVAAGSA